jgi:hypothetical protein
MTAASRSWNWGSAGPVLRLNLETCHNPVLLKKKTAELVKLLD